VIKYLFALIVGVVAGVAAFLALLYFNPLTTQKGLSPITVTDNNVIKLGYSAAAEEMLIYTNDGESSIDPHPAKVPQLWEAPIRQTRAIATVLTDIRGENTGIGIKFSSDSESTSILNGQAIVDSVWHIYMPDRGSLFVAQSENFWSYLREIVIPAYWSSAKSWRGIWNGNVTSGPGALGTARVIGGSGEFTELETEAVESLSARAYSVELGPVAIDGELSVEIPREEMETSPDP
jgi:hypothetical protein